jgi:hypothetical protein
MSVEAARSAKPSVWRLPRIYPDTGIVGARENRSQSSIQIGDGVPQPFLPPGSTAPEKTLDGRLGNREICARRRGQANLTCSRRRRRNGRRMDRRPRPIRRKRRIALRPGRAHCRVPRLHPCAGDERLRLRRGRPSRPAAHRDGRGGVAEGLARHLRCRGPRPGRPGDRRARPLGAGDELAGRRRGDRPVRPGASGDERR